MTKIDVSKSSLTCNSLLIVMKCFKTASLSKFLFKHHKILQFFQLFLANNVSHLFMPLLKKSLL